MKKKAPFITIEGIDGAGKTTLITGIVKYLEEKKIQYWKYSMLPKGGIREEVLNNPFLNLKQRLALIATAGNMALNEAFTATHDGSLVIMDRGIDSFYAYQGHGSRLMNEVNLIMAEIFPPPIMPDLTFFIDANVELVKQRIEIRDKAKDIIESMDNSFHERVYAGFKSRIVEAPDRFYILDANDKPKVMANDACLRLEWLLEAYD